MRVQGVGAAGIEPVVSPDETGLARPPVFCDLPRVNTELLRC